MLRLICDINEERGLRRSLRADEYVFVVGTDGKFPHRDVLLSSYKSGNDEGITVYKITLPALGVSERESDAYAEMIARGVASRDFDLRGCYTLLFKNNMQVTTQLDLPAEDTEDEEF